MIFGSLSIYSDLGNTVKDYVGSFVYENGNMQFFQFDEGVVQNNGTEFQYQYQIKDHLGNVRVQFADLNDDNIINANDIAQESHYYPFGMKLGGEEMMQTSGTDNKFLYNGKELVNDHNLNWYHYGARYYDPQLGRWHAVGPFSTSFYPSKSPYISLLNNPIIYTDYEGNFIFYLKQKQAQ